MIDTVTLITILTGLISFLTLTLVSVIAWVIVRMQKSIERSHERLDLFEKEVRKEFVSDDHCKSRRERQTCGKE